MSEPNFDLLGRIVTVLMTIPHYWGILVDWCEKLASPAGAEWAAEFARFLRKEPTWVRRWYEKDGVIYFEVVSDGTTGPQWIERLDKKGFRLSRWAKDVLNSSDFKPTNGVTFKIAVLKGSLFTDSDRITSKIRAESERRTMGKPNAEVACLIRDLFSDEELEAMGLWWIVVFHEPIKDSGGDLRLLASRRADDGCRLSAYSGGPYDRWSFADGFAFVLQVSA